FVPSLGAFPAVIAMHGQTVAHLPRRATLQLGDASRVALRTGVPTIADFRSANIAAGGEGAPLVPFADFVLFGTRAPVALLNLGGIANLTLIPKAEADSVIAFDTGPANILSDLIAQRDGNRFDEAGGGARNPTLVKALRAAVAPTPVRTSDELGIPVTAREAVAFAILGAYRMQGKPNILPRATGASRAVSGGAIHQP